MSSMDEIRAPEEEDLDGYYRAAQSWSADREAEIARSRRIAWLVAGTAAAIALFEAIALIALVPLKTVEPYTLLVDRQTGFVQELKPLERQSIRPDEAMERSFLAQYVIAREGFDIDTVKHNYRKVALWSAGDARTRYVAEMQASNPASPLAALPARTLIEVEIRSISAINAETAMVRYVTIQTDPGGQRQAPQPWVAIVRYRFSGAAMSAADRLINPLGFQVLRYSRNAEMAPEPATASYPAALPAERGPAAQAPATQRPVILVPRPARSPSRSAGEVAQ